MVSIASLANSSIGVISACNDSSSYFCIDKCEKGRCSAKSLSLQEDSSKKFDVKVTNSNLKATVLEMTDNCNVANSYFSFNKEKTRRVNLAGEKLLTIPLLLEVAFGDEECTLTFKLLDKDGYELNRLNVDVLVWY